MRSAIALFFTLATFVCACAVADPAVEIEPDATACVTLASCGCTPGMTYTCDTKVVVTCMDSGAWPENACMATDASADGAIDSTTPTDATTDAPDSPSDVESDAAADGD